MNHVTKSFSKIHPSFDRKTIKLFKQKHHRKARRCINQQLSQGIELVVDIKPLTNWDID